MAALHKKSVLVLGGSRGIGAAIVRRFASDGASVVFTYAGSPEAAAKLATETGSTAVQTDSADRDAVIKRVRDSGPCTPSTVRLAHNCMMTGTSLSGRTIIGLPLLPSIK
ncbi:3-oxoacyl-[acyl-carrier-protein] reductase FabG [Raoultella terrigena]|jgi:NAD(P)-dependent dehydrogenase (short-subunit alcohol dehydrogenase family)|uniref:3-oxoacyl-[acyl-carrier-protein] reductase FabG n=1 Tax=Raoultella terrigena TaxID=577 RepID=A0A485BEF6_RAOTE|nr:3-oxoacyl-[acyl-carrier-protein] reductase FabG [Raoultella terrigena]